MNINTASGYRVQRKGVQKFCMSAALLSASVGLASADDEAGSSEPITVIADRIETTLDKVGNSLTVLDVQTLSKAGVRELDDALKLVPGVNSDTSSGQRGTTSSVFIRGNESAYTGIIVDGFRMDSGGFGSSFTQGNFLGTSNLLGLSKIEVLKGPQSVLYGQSSISGVLGLSNVKGSGAFSGGAHVEAGSFGTLNSTLGLQGSSNDFSYSLNLGNEQTDNDLPNNEFESNSYALRLDYDVSERFRVGLTVRGVDSELRLPNYSDPNYDRSLDVDFNYNLSTVFAEFDVSDRWTSKVTLGNYTESYATFDPNNDGVETYSTDTGKFAAYWDNTIHWNSQFSTAAGISYEKSEFESSSTFGDVDQSTRKQTGIYINQVAKITEDFNVSGGLRWTNYEEEALGGFDKDEITWKLASSYKLASTDTIFRASVGTGFQLPTFYQIYNITPNNDLDPAESIGWDFGVQQNFNEGQYKVGATYFATRVDSAIDYLTFTTGAVYENRDEVTKTSGVEVFGNGSFLDDKLSVNLSYTWLERQALADPHFLPEHTGSLSVTYQATDKWDLGVISTYQGRRALFGDPLKAYALVNLHTNYKVNDHVTLNARVDNLFDTEYFHGVSPAFGGGETVRPGRGVGFFGGVAIQW